MHAFYLFIILFTLSCGKAVETSQWRGPNRDGVYPEKNLLTEWPENGPEMVWVYEGLGAGHGSVSINNDKIFVLGMPDTIGVVYALDLEGNLLWKKEYGEEWHRSYTGSRSTPTVVGKMMYFMSGPGIVYCFDTDNGEQLWSVDILNKFNVKNITWGMTESLLVLDDLVFCTPGGEEHNLVALNRFTGETIWTSPGKGEPPAYCSPALVRHNNSSLVVTITAASIICVDALTGQLYWSFPQQQNNKIHANTPLYYEGRVYASSYKDKEHSGLVSIRLSEDGKTAETEWRNESFANLMGGIVIKDGYLYGSLYRSKKWSCVDISDGKIMYEFEGLGEGVIILADGLFYCYTEEGEMALVDANQTTFNVISKFKINHGTDQHWAHPVIHKGRLYVRHGDALGVYDISKKNL